MPDIGDALSAAGFPHRIANEIIAIKGGSTTNPVRLAAMGVSYPLAIEMSAQLTSKVVNQNALMSLGMSGSQATAFAAIVAGAAAAVYRNIADHLYFPNSALSNGTDTTHNSRTVHWNSTPEAQGTVQTVDTGTRFVSTLEGDAPNDITLSRSIEYPAGTFTQVTWGGQSSVVVPVGQIVKSDPIVLPTPLPANGTAAFFCRNFVSVPSGSKWIKGGQNQTGLGEQSETGVGLANKTLSGTIAVQDPNPYRPCAILGVTARKSYMVVGDSMSAGSLDLAVDTHAATGFLQRGVSGSAPFVTAGVNGTTAQSQAGAMARRIAFAVAVGITDVICNLGINDLILNGRTAAQVIADLKTIAGGFKAAGLRFYQATMIPNVTSTDNFWTLAGQTPTAAVGSGPSGTRGVINAFHRSGAADFDGFIEVTDALEIARDDGRFAVGSAFNALYAASFGATASGSPTTTVIPVGSALTANNIGLVEFLTGALAGQKLAVASNTTGALTLSAAASSAPSAGDTMTLYPKQYRATTDGIHPSGDGTFGSVMIGAAQIRSWVLANRGA